MEAPLLLGGVGALGLAELTGESFKIDIHALLANDEHAIALMHATSEREGKTLDDKTVQVFHVKDGKSPSSGCTPATWRQRTPSGVDRLAGARRSRGRRGDRAALVLRTGGCSRPSRPRRPG